MAMRLRAAPLVRIHLGISSSFHPPSPAAGCTKSQGPIESAS
jgi:hypothetical protein